VSTNADDYDYSPVVRLLAQWHEVPLEAAEAGWNRIIAAFKQAMAEFGIPEHPDGRCPDAGCQHSALEPLVTARADELLGLPIGDDDA
jgi:hypothetical protein